MNREASLLVILAIAVVLIGLMAWGWWRRARRDAGLRVPLGVLPPTATVRATFRGLYVASTVHDDPLDRLALRGFGIRSRVTFRIADMGLALELPGADDVFIAAESIVDVAQATVAIDRVVEKDGLTRLTWTIDGDRVIDSYFRPQDASARALADAIRPIIPVPQATAGSADAPADAPIPTGNDE